MKELDAAAGKCARQREYVAFGPMDVGGADAKFRQVARPSSSRPSRNPQKSFRGAPRAHWCRWPHRRQRADGTAPPQTLCLRGPHYRESTKLADSPSGAGSPSSRARIWLPGLLTGIALSGGTIPACTIKRPIRSITTEVRSAANDS